MRYDHTQTGNVIIGSMGAVALYLFFIMKQTGSSFQLMIIIAVVFFILGSFISLNVKVDEEYVRIRFGYGIFRKKFSIKEINSIKAVKNRWYTGWGIRFQLWPRMWIYNVSGFDAVEMRMTDGKIVRIGTDEPNKLEQAINDSKRL